MRTIKNIYLKNCVNNVVVKSKNKISKGECYAFSLFEWWKY